MKAYAVTALAAATVLTLGGCAAGLNVPGLPSQSPTPEPVYVTAPLTGVKYLEGTPQALQLAKPSVACKIDNGSEAPRPQAGLNSTDIVFDEMVEGGLTRLVAIWHSSQPDAIGPVRSIRPMDPDIVSPFGGIVCYSGGQWVFVKAMEAAPVFNASETSEQGKGTFSRSKDRIAPHNVIVNVQKLAMDHPELTPPPAQFSYSADLASSTAVAGASAVAVKDFTVKFPQASAQWIASADGQNWKRVQDGKIHTDKLDGEQIHAVNIVVMEVAEDRSYKDGKYGNVPKAVMIGTGGAWVFSGGKYIEATWSKSSATSPIVLTDLAGAVVQLAPGNSWVELMPKAPEGKLVINKIAVASPSPSASAKK
ncbi:MAG: hypothetical protein RLY34_786 [Actinomycetota bacterium]|jgi:hypothetical protein